MLDEGLRDIPGIEPMEEVIISPPLIVKDLIKDEQGTPLFDYETWALELINHSDAFIEKAHGEPFTMPCSEAHGEPDAVTESYCVDFKLILGQSMQRAVRECSWERTMFKGMTLVHTSRSKEDMPAVRLHVVLRGYSLERLRDLMSTPCRKGCLDDAERDVRSFLKSIDHPKNLLLIYPCFFYSNDDRPIARKSVDLALLHDFKTAMQLRMQLHLGCETFLAYFFEADMVILRACGDELSGFDSVPVNMSPTFMDILRSHCGGSKYARMLKDVGVR